MKTYQLLKMITDIRDGSKNLKNYSEKEWFDAVQSMDTYINFASESSKENAKELIYLKKVIEKYALAKFSFNIANDLIK